MICHWQLACSANASVEVEDKIHWACMRFAMGIGAIFAISIAYSVALAGVIGIALEQTSNLAKVSTPFESKTRSGQFVLQSPNGSIDSPGAG